MSGWLQGKQQCVPQQKLDSRKAGHSARGRGDKVGYRARSTKRPVSHTALSEALYVLRLARRTGRAIVQSNWVVLLMRVSAASIVLMSIRNIELRLLQILR